MARRSTHTFARWQNMPPVRIIWSPRRRWQNTSSFRIIWSPGRRRQNTSPFRIIRSLGLRWQNTSPLRIIGSPRRQRQYTFRLRIIEWWRRRLESGLTLRLVRRSPRRRRETVAIHLTGLIEVVQASANSMHSRTRWTFPVGSFVVVMGTWGAPRRIFFTNDLAETFASNAAAIEVTGRRNKTEGNRGILP